MRLFSVIIIFVIVFYIVVSFRGESDPNTVEGRSSAAMKDIAYKAVIFIAVFSLFVFNLLAVSISLQCNQHRDVVFKISSALFAFMFGLLYIIMNYVSYRVKMRHNPCMLHANNPFPF